MKEIIQNFKPDIIHSGHIWILSSIATEFNIPTIVSSHGTDILGSKNAGKETTTDLAHRNSAAEPVVAVFVGMDPHPSETLRRADHRRHSDWQQEPQGQVLEPGPGQELP